MIARLHGRVVGVEADSVVVDVGGVGYRVHVPASVLADLGPEGTTVTLHTLLVVRENEWLLVGAVERDAITLFSQLLGVGGVGPRAALALLSVLDPPALRRAVLEEDLDALTRAPGVGRKTAQRVVLELKSRFASEPGAALVGGPSSAADQEAIEALAALGYSVAEARKALAAADVPAEASVEDRILAALRSLSGPADV